MKITLIYEPVQNDLLLVEERLKTLAKVEFPQLADILNHTIVSSGKRIRPALTLLSGKLFNYRLDKLIPMAAAVELLHTATLVHDDTLDNSKMRRGKPTVSSLWSGSIAVLVGDYLFANSARMVTSTGNIRVISLFAQTLATICNGELAQNFTAYNVNQTRHHYFRRIGDKTASLFSAATESGAILGEAPLHEVEALKNYGYNLGIAFQVVDDILDFTGEAAELGKPVASDLLQGTLTLPAILLLERHPDNNPIKLVFQAQQQEANLRLAVDMISNSDIIKESYRIAGEFCHRAIQEIKDLPDSAAKQSLIGLAEYVVERRS